MRQNYQRSCPCGFTATTRFAHQTHRQSCTAWKKKRARGASQGAPAVTPTVTPTVTA